MKKYLPVSFLIIIAFVIGAIVRTSFAGPLTPSVSPASTMYTLDGIYNKLIDNTTSVTEGAQSFTTPGSVSATFHTLKQIYESIPTLNATKILTGTTYMGVVGMASSGGILKTGQTHCNASDTDYGNVSQIPCTGTHQDGQSLKGLARSYTDNADGTISDNSTGLMWQKCSDGQSGADCSGGSAVAELFDDGNGNLGSAHQPAINYCENLSLATHTDWRLPNVNELQSLVDYGQVNPAINTTYFPATQSDGYWSSTAYEGYANYAWFVNFGVGYVYTDGMDGNYYVRCVRG